MAQSEEINKSKKRKLLLDNDIYELDPEDRSPVDSPITVKAQSFEDELIELDASQESTTCDNLSESVSFDDTVGPGVAPQGFVLIDETITVDDDTDSRQTQNQPPLQTLNPIFKVMFRDIDAARKHREKIKEFLQNLIAKNTKVKSETDSSGLILEIWDQHVVPEDGEISGSSEHENSQEAIGDQLFTIDTKPKLKDDLDIPTYGKKYQKVLEKQAEETLENTSKDCRPQLSCFNCLGNHNLRDCTKPRNHNEINKNRKEFITKAGPKNGRYHLEDEQKFGHFVPGQLSKNLRRALGLRDNELPKHIYSMRILGYPPGWIEEARVQHSGLTLFDSDGCVELDPADEEGEIIIAKERDEFDVKKIVDFPGFNVNPPDGTRDESKYYGTPQMQEMQSKEVMLSTMIGRKAQDGYQRKKMKVTRSGTVTNASIIPSEMEVEDIDDTEVEILAVNGLFIPPLPIDTPAKPPEPPIVSEDSDNSLQGLKSPEPTNVTEERSSGANSPSLSDLEIAKKQLLAALDQPGTPSTPGTPVNVGKPRTISEISKSADMPSPPITELTPQSSRTPNKQDTPKSSSIGAVRSIDLGTPILQSTSPYSKLPSSEKFSKDICDIMNFENLPDSTGKYKKMTGIIQKVRDVVARLQQE